MWVDPSSDAVNQCTTYDNSGDTADAQQVEKIATQPWAYWVSGGDNTLEPQDVSWISSTAAAGYLPVITAYSIPNRDLGGLAAGGSTSAANYQTWISSLAQAIGNNKAVVILEPDATADIPNMSSTDQATRYSLLQYAVSTLKAQPNVTVYIDAGNPNWVSAAEMAPILQSAGIAQADGFSINVSNFVDTPTCLSYGDTLSALVGGKHYVVDTSRNGQGAAPGGAWCNPPGRGLGWQPTADTADPLCDAYLWIKAPGYTDGSCNGGPSWGWWASYALGLCQNSIF
jgi:endoglucanase